jgi:spermidine/putrescine transport system ATP-binding protein
MPSYSIQIAGVSVIYGNGSNAVMALSNVSLDVLQGEFFTLLGPSGCGKTTLLRCIAGFEQPSQGSILLAGQPLDGLPPYKRPVNTVFQSYALFPHLSVAQNIAFGLEERREHKANIQKTVAAMLALVKLDGYGARMPAQLSGGQQQRVALARALANQPKVLLLDESLSALDLKLRQEMRLELKRLQRDTGITFIFVTHDQDEALTMSDRIAVMQAGRIAQIGSPADIYDRPRSRYVADFIGDTNFLSGMVEHGDLKLADGQFKLPNSFANGTILTVAIRPERLHLLPKRDRAGSGMQSAIQTVVYMGTDTIYHLANGVRVRAANATGAQARFSPGDSVWLQVDADAIQVLEDQPGVSA